MTEIIELDLRGFKCPLPVLKTRHKMRKMQSGEQVCVLTDDPMAAIDIPHFCNETGQILIKQTTGEDDNCQFVIERGSEKL